MYLECTMNKMLRPTGSYMQKKILIVSGKIQFTVGIWETICGSRCTLIVFLIFA